MKKRKVIIKANRGSDSRYSKRYVKAAEDDEDDFDMGDIDDADGIMDAIDDVADNVEDIQDQIDDIEEDDVDIAINNNIADHYIAECTRCGGVFISAVVESDQEIEYVSGTCPLCGRDTEQELKWIIKAVE